MRMFLIALLVSGCGVEFDGRFPLPMTVDSVDAGDAGQESLDSGLLDASVASDASMSPSDAGQLVDAGMTEDAGQDAGQDAGMDVDAGDCVPETDSMLCSTQDLPVVCGPLMNMTDNCGNVRNVVSCGTCGPNLTCNGSGACVTDAAADAGEPDAGQIADAGQPDSGMTLVDDAGETDMDAGPEAFEQQCSNAGGQSVCQCGPAQVTAPIEGCSNIVIDGDTIPNCDLKCI